MGHKSYTGQIQLIFISSFLKMAELKGTAFYLLVFLMAFL